MRKTKLLLVYIQILIAFGSVMGQTKIPTLMILPSDNWCTQRFFMTEYDNQGTIQKVPNYKQAFQEDTELGQIIGKIGALMIEKGFLLKDAEQELKNIETRSAEDKMTTNDSSGSSIAESPLDKLKKTARADIIIQVWWKVTRTEEGKVVSFTIEAFDAYSSKRIATSTGISKPNEEDIIPEILIKAVKKNIKPFVSQLKKHFSDISNNGREVIITLKRWDDWDKNFDSKINDKEINEYINEWMQKNTLNGQFSMVDASENVIRFEQVRISLYDKDGIAIDARQFVIELKKYLQSSPLNIESKLITRGLGEAILILGEI